jgi:hypothetical protein
MLMFGPPLILPRQLTHSPDSFTSMHATPTQALQMHVEVRARHSLAMHFLAFVGSDYEALKPIVELEQFKHAMEMVTGAADRQGSEDEWKGVGCGQLVDGRRDGRHRCRRDHCGAYWQDLRTSYLWRAIAP